MRDDLVRTIRDREAILFAGAGVSMTVGLPSWSTLIEHMAEELGFDRKLSIDPNINYFTLAEYYRLKQGSIGPLRSWMDRNWSIPEDKLRESRVHELIVQLDFPIVSRPPSGSAARSSSRSSTPRTSRGCARASRRSSSSTAISTTTPRS
jgi:hypothetical protein